MVPEVNFMTSQPAAVRLTWYPDAHTAHREVL